MSFSAENLTTAQKQAESAHRTSTIKQQKSYARIENALKAWPRGMALTQAALALRTDLSVRTVGRYWHVDWPTGLSVIISGSEGNLARSAHPLRQLRTLKDLADAFEKDCLRLTYYEDHIAAQRRRGAEPCWPETPEDWLNPEVAWGYRHAEEATENAFSRQDRRQKSKKRCERRHRLREAGKNNAISIRSEETDRIEQQFAELMLRAEKEKWKPHIKEKLFFGRISSRKSIKRAYDEGISLRFSEMCVSDRPDKESDSNCHVDEFSASIRTRSPPAKGL
ncbi:hypothetical protein AA0488_0751 [Kozakia baliensis NRIC 0488]|nr:hypothetical protein AA0488_0751 [Kozakia baliensis NRIC 0488]GEL64828.1 hypothetical protein KBA01_21140 [Kozakia baliensis]